MKSNYAVLIILSVILSGLTPSSQTNNAPYQYAEGFSYIEIVKGAEVGNKKIPLLVAFHYSSSSPEELVGYYDSLDFPVRIIIPRGNYRKRNGHSYYPPDHYSKDSVTQMQTVKSTVDSIAVFLKAINKKYKSKSMVSGISQGGDISLLLAIYYPDLITASFPLLGFVHRQVYETLTKPRGPQVPIYVFHGEDDKIVSLNYTKKEVASLQKKFQISLHTYPQTEHDVTAAMEKDYSLLMKNLSRAFGKVQYSQ